MVSATAKNIFTKLYNTVTTGAVVSVAIAVNAAAATAATFTPQLIQEDLFFGRNIPGDGEVSEEQFKGFVNDVITPRFPDGLTIFDANGQFKDSTGTIVREKSKNVTIFVEDSPNNQIAINEIGGSYLQQFNQESVLRVTNKDNLRVSFGLDEDLFNNYTIPKFIKVDLFFGRSTPNNGEVSEEQFQGFINNVITPRFPSGLTIDANGQFLNSAGIISREKSKDVTLLIEDTVENEASINEIVKTYVQDFNQESVLQAVNEDVRVSFGLEEDLFDNSLVPKFIRADLFFGRSIPGGGEVSVDQFQGFVNDVITPRFPDGLTNFDANGQFLNSTGTIIQENSNLVTLLFEDTLKNEASINEIVRAYVEQFNQESVLQVVDQNVEVAFITTSKPISVPESSFAWGLLGLGLGSAGLALKKQLTNTKKDTYYKLLQK